MADAVVEEIDGRRIQVDGHWLVDSASCNYLGLDLDLEVINQVPAYLARWRTHPSWARAIASPEPYRRVEAVVSELLGVSDVLAFPTLTHTHSGVLPALAGEGTVVVDLRAHRTIHDAATIAAARGATVRRFRPGDIEHARRLLRAAPKGPRLVAWTASTRSPETRPTYRPSPPWPGSTTPYCMSTTPTASASSANGTATTRRPTGAAATRSCAGLASATTTSCSPPASPRPTRRCWPSCPARES